MSSEGKDVYISGHKVELVPLEHYQADPTIDGIKRAAARVKALPRLDGILIRHVGAPTARAALVVVVLHILAAIAVIGGLS